ncbi:MAG: hypothetical protein QF824_00725 [Candidatus Woesearchaeota archaeon]|jgi:hypothetical protein|nr:hypothetical protein [Candidatus Woesearchaeota archaeon]
MRKKGSLSLSINAIVVLILAITMLGLGLGFIKTMFGKVTDITKEQLGNEPDPAPPSANIPLTLSKDYVVVQSGKTKPIKVSMHCAHAVGCVDPNLDENGDHTTAPASVSCTDGITFIPTSPTVSVNEYSTGHILVSVPSSVSAGTIGVCTVTSKYASGTTLRGIAAVDRKVSFTVEVG